MQQDGEDREKHWSRFQRIWAKDPIAIISLVFSAFAFFISLASLYTSHEAFNLSDIEYTEERAIVLTAKFGKNTDSLALLPTDSGFRFLDGMLEFPSTIHRGPLEVQEDGSVWGMATLAFELDKYIYKTFPPTLMHQFSPGEGLPI